MYYACGRGNREEAMQHLERVEASICTALQKRVIQVEDCQIKGSLLNFNMAQVRITSYRLN